MNRLEIVAVFILSAVLVAGCGGSGSGSLTGSSSGVSGLSGGAGSMSAGFSSNPADIELGPLVSTIGDTTPTQPLPTNPEPATMALVASGLAAFALMRRKKKK